MICLKRRLLSFSGGVGGGRGGMRGRLRLLSTCERRCRVLRYKWKQREAARTRGQMPAVLRGGGSTHARPPWAFCPPHTGPPRL